MLKNTFLHIPSITKKKETEIWKSNIYSWHEYPNNDSKIHSYVQDSINAYENKNIPFFLTHLPSNQHWRAYKDFKCCFLDIETTGLSKHYNQLTVIGLYNGEESKIFINGKNLHEFPEEINKYDLIVTFNGKCFDIPFLKEKFPEINFDKFHVDLRYVMKELGYVGGLKCIEKDLNIQRDDDLEDINGYEAVRLWKQYQRGNEEALQLLIKYNLADIENLKTMMDFAFDKMKDKYFHSVI